MNKLWTVVWKKDGRPVVPYDCNPHSDDEGMLVYRSILAARLSAKHQNALYGIDCVAKRLDLVVGGE